MVEVVAAEEVKAMEAKAEQDPVPPLLPSPPAARSTTTMPTTSPPILPPPPLPTSAPTEDVNEDPNQEPAASDSNADSSSYSSAEDEPLAEVAKREKVKKEQAVPDLDIVILLVLDPGEFPGAHLPIRLPRA